MPLVFVCYCTTYYHHKDCFSLVEPYPGAGSPETRIPFPKHTAHHQKANWKLICNMEGREPSLVFLPSFQITSLCLGILMAWGRGTPCVLREQDSNASSSSKRNEVIWGLQR